MAGLTHLNPAGEARMVDVGAKDDTRRIAEARGRITLSRSAFDALVAGQLKKGDALGAARIAGIMAAKRTSDLIPLCHPITLTRVEVTLTPVAIDDASGAVDIAGRVECVGKTGVEMEALTAVSLAALTIYDMCKALSHDIVIRETKLMAKSGGKRDFLRKS